jgi:hypothetical protein
VKKFKIRMTSTNLVVAAILIYRNHNVDASFILETGQASTGVIIRNHQGTGLLSAWRVLFDCYSAEEAGFVACYDALHVAFQWCQAPLILESDNDVYLYQKLILK